MRGGQLSGGTRSALCVARHVARDAGASIFAVVLSDPLSSTQIDDLAQRLGQAGADRVLLCAAAGLGAPPLWMTHGPALLATTRTVTPALIFFPSGTTAAELGPPLAAQLSASYWPGSEVQTTTASGGERSFGRRRVQLQRSSVEGEQCRITIKSFDRPVVLSVPPGGVAPIAGGGSDIEVELVSAVAAATPFTETTRVPDPFELLDDARGIVLVGKSLGPSVADPLRALAAPDLAVLVENDAAAATLRLAAPSFVLRIGDSRLPVGRSPQTRIGQVRFADQPPVDPGDADVIWTADLAVQIASGWRDLAALLGPEADWDADANARRESDLR